MPIFAPFRAYLPANNDVAKQVILPENLRCNPVNQSIELGDNPQSFSRVLAAANPDLQVNTAQSFGRSVAVFDHFLRQQIYVQAAEPAFYIYQTTYHDTTQTGIIGCINTAEYTQNIIKKHENTRLERRRHLGSFLGALKINTTPIILSYFNQHSIDEMVAKATQAAPMFSINHHTGLSIKVWASTDPQKNIEITQAFEKINALYIADGHHRAAVFEDMGAPNFSALLVPHNQLLIYPFYRLIKNHAQFDIAISLQKIAEYYTIKSCNLAQMYHQYLPENNFLMCMQSETYVLKPKKTLPKPQNLLDSLDVSILQNMILAPAFGINNPSTDPNLAFGSRNISLVDFKHLLHKPDTACIFLCKAPNIETIFAVADQDAIMPPKSTSFEPKVLSGLIVQKL